MFRGDVSLPPSCTDEPGDIVFLIRIAEAEPALPIDLRNAFGAVRTVRDGVSNRQPASESGVAVGARRSSRLPGRQAARPPGSAAAGWTRTAAPPGSRGRLAVSPEWAPLHRSGAAAWPPPWPRPRASPRARAANPRSGGAGAVGAGRTGRGSGNLEIWNPGNLRGCGARQVFRFSGFQVFTLSGPAPAAGRRPGRGWLQRRRPREARN